MTGDAAAWKGAVSDGGRPSATIPGVRFGNLSRLRDTRGWFMEAWRASTFGDDAAGGKSGDGSGNRSGDASDAQPGGDLQFVQANLSSSGPGVLRGLHLHRRQIEYSTVVSGHAFLALVDVRPPLADPAAAPIVETRELGEGGFVLVPAGVAHGFLALEPMLLLYLLATEFDGTDEAGFAWNDPEAAVPWPPAGTADGLPILSDRDRSNPNLATLLAHLRS